MKVILEIDHTVSKEEITSWIEEVLIPNNPCVWGYSFEEHHCGSCHNSQLEKENAELKEDVDGVVNINIKAQNIIAELKAEKEQIQEQVKKILLDENAEIGDVRKLVGMDWYDVKEIEQLKYNLKCRDDENAELKAHLKAVDDVNEKMKCCENCKNKKGWKGEKPCLDCKYNPFGEGKEDKWEMRND